MEDQKDKPNREIFDKEVFEILKHSQPNEVGYINKDLALELMDEGYLHKSPKPEWWRSGHKITEKGQELFNKLIKDIRDNHGHKWQTKKEYEKEVFDDDCDDEDCDEPYPFAYAEGYHNGFVCTICGYSFCHHCTPEYEVSKCTGKE